jgi:hypothetical protein
VRISALAIGLILVLLVWVILSMAVNERMPA